MNSILAKVQFVLFITIVFVFYSYFWSKFEFNLGKSQSLLHPPIFPLISATSIFWESPILKISFPAFHSDIIIILPIVLQPNIGNTGLVFFMEIWYFPIGSLYSIGCVLILLGLVGFLVLRYGMDCWWYLTVLTWCRVSSSLPSVEIH